MVIPGLKVDERRKSRFPQLPLAAPRGGIMLHYDDSSRDDWAVEWFEDPRCMNGYTWLVLDDGRVVELADPELRTPHAGVCKSANANSLFYGIAAATNARILATEPQVTALALTCAALFKWERWPAESIGSRIVGHDAEAIWTPEHTANRALWGNLGRKVDPTGLRADGRAIISIQDVRRRVRELLDR